MIGRLAGRSSGAPEESKPSRTWGAASSGSTSPIGWSSGSLPCSTSCIAATEVTALVIEAIRNTVSGVIAGPFARSRIPKAPSYKVPRSVAAIATTPGTSRASTARLRTASMRASASIGSS